MTIEDQNESLINCPECNRSIDEDCEMCPGCGYFIMESDRRQSAGSFQSYRGCFVAIAILLILIFLAPLLSRLLELISG